MLEIKPLTYFIAAYEEQSISAAAVRCFIAQPSISHAIKSLEDKLNRVLFIRSKTGITPTAQGHELYQHAKALIAHTHQIEQSLSESPQVPINLYFQGDIALQTIHYIIEHLKHTPHVQLHIVSQPNQADIAFMDAEQVGKRFHTIPLYKEGFAILLHHQNPLSRKPVLQLKDLAQGHFIERPYCSLRTEFLKLLKEENITLNITSQAENDIQVVDLVSLGFGISGIPKYRAHNLPKTVVVRPVDINFQREVVMAIRSSRKDILPITEMINWDWLKQQL